MTTQWMKCDSTADLPAESFAARGSNGWAARGSVSTRLGGGLAAAALLFAAVGVAQQNPAMGGQPAQQQQTMPGSTGLSGAAGAPGSAAGLPETTPGMPANSYSDMAFVEDTIQSDEAQVQMSRLAQTKSQSPDVQQFGQKMVEVRSDLNTQLKPAAKQLGVDDSKGPSKKIKQQIAQLASLSGPDFDTAYIMAMAKEQQKSLKAFKDEANNSQSPGLQQAAKADEPVLSAHYEVLEKLAQAHNVTIPDSK